MIPFCSTIPVNCHRSTAVQPLRNVLLSRCSYDMGHVTPCTVTGSHLLNEFWWRKSFLFACSTLLSRSMAAAGPKTEVTFWKVLAIYACTPTQHRGLCAFRTRLTATRNTAAKTTGSKTQTSQTSSSAPMRQAQVICQQMARALTACTAVRRTFRLIGMMLLRLQRNAMSQA